MFKRLLIVAVLLAASSSSQANDQERAEILRLIHSLESARPLIEQAEHVSDPYDAYAVDYPVIRQELDLIINGLKEVTELPRREPRQINPAELPPIEGRYVP